MDNIAKQFSKYPGYQGLSLKKLITDINSVIRSNAE